MRAVDVHGYVVQVKGLESVGDALCKMVSMKRLEAQPVAIAKQTYRYRYSSHWHISERSGWSRGYQDCQVLQDSSALKRQYLSTGLTNHKGDFSIRVLLDVRRDSINVSLVLSHTTIGNRVFSVGGQSGTVPVREIVYNESAYSLGVASAVCVDLFDVGQVNVDGRDFSRSVTASRTLDSRSIGLPNDRV